MARESIVDSIKVTSEELLETLVLENSQLRLELYAQKLLNNKFKNFLQELDSSESED
jgi:hypothetical protein